MREREKARGREGGRERERARMWFSNLLEVFGGRAGVGVHDEAEQEGRQPKKAFKLPWREAGPPNHHDDKMDSDQ